MSDVLDWVIRAVQLIPVIKELWGAVESDDENRKLAAQFEMVRQIKKAQVIAELDEP